MTPGQIKPFYGFQQGQFNQYVQRQPLARTAQAGALAAYGGLGGLLAPLAGAEDYYGAIIKQHGALPQSYVHDVAQQTLGGLPEGSLHSPSAIAAQVLNQRAAQEQRLAGATQQVGALSGQRQALQTGALNQLITTQGANVGAFTTLQNPILQVPLMNLQARIQEAQAQAQLQGQSSAAKGGTTSGALSAIGTIAPIALAAFSDERLKTKIRDTGLETLKGIPLKTFEYKGIPGQRFLFTTAQDVEKKMPEAVFKDAAGIRLVDLQKVGLPLIRLKH